MLSRITPLEQRPVLQDDVDALLANDVRNNTGTGPAHRVSGPYLGNSETNDTDIEENGLANGNATGDDSGAPNDDENGVSSFPAVGITPGDCDGLIIDGSPGSTFYCVAVEVTNPADKMRNWQDGSIFLAVVSLATIIATILLTVRFSTILMLEVVRVRAGAAIALKALFTSVTGRQTTVFRSLRLTQAVLPAQPGVQQARRSRAQSRSGA